MTKTSINSTNKKEIHKFILDSRLDNKTDQEIYNVLAPKYFDRRAIALLITGTVTQELKEKYKKLNLVLLILILITIISKILPIFGIAIESNALWPLLFVFIVPLINIYFLFSVLHFNAVEYKLIGMFAIVGLLQTLKSSINQNEITNTTELIIVLIFAACITGLSFYLRRKLLPNYNPKTLNKDADGEYILN
jgi:hypothetical protein